jgi:hypothetical protein
MKVALIVAAAGALWFVTAVSVASALHWLGLV